ncbi:murein transglycosylase [Blastomyces dermatitidis ER-3]|uniref:Murein transglycosylase n=1 Tax=Ajellomyces dermatitidis (strain ER-3 / ATCC MYA-2586) TaxID=559297 RepID=A0ABP2ETT0_AJEDR|nr:murein transglycosylase [Blastomyces dermatitidis ER-3]EEQ86113.2 murein transglycosylase [Blastomyces dermatitidis ER-3]
MHFRPASVDNIYVYPSTMLNLLLIPLLCMPLSLVLALALARSNTHQLSPRTKTGNPIIEGWYADPELRIYEGAYYLYPTYSAAFDSQTFFDAFVSHDLLTWEPTGRLLDFADVPWTTNRAAWAPTVGHKDGSYYLYYSAGEGVGIGVAVSHSPAGPFTDVLGGPLIGEYVFGAQPIDAMVFMDSDGNEGGKGEGRNYLYWGGWGHAVVGELADDMVSFKGDFVEVTPDKEYVEGPWMLKRKGVYYFLYSVGGWGDPSYAVKYVKADNPMGPFDGPSKLILSSDPAIGTSTGHNSVFHVDDEYFIVYHRRSPTDTERDHRVVCIDKLEFNDDGEIEVVKITNEGVDGIRLERN